MIPRVCTILFLTFSVLLSFALFAPSHAVAASPCWVPPVVAGRVVDEFREPPCPFCAGNRGLEYRVPAHADVSAVASGVVTWAGDVAGTRYVVVRHGNGWRVTYGKLSATSLRRGDRIVGGTVIGRVSGSFYFGLRVGETYRDPAPHLGRLVGRPRLVPIDGSRPHRPPAPRLQCGR